MNREAIYAALFDLGKTAFGVTTSSRRLRHIEDVEPGEFPAFFQTQIQEDWQQGTNLPPVGVIQAEWWLYVYNADVKASHAVQMNPLVDAAIATLKLPPTPARMGKQDLGGLIESVRLGGAIQYAEGALDDRGFVRIPLNLHLVG